MLVCATLGAQPQSHSKYLRRNVPSCFGQVQVEKAHFEISWNPLFFLTRPAFRETSQSELDLLEYYQTVTDLEKWDTQLQPTLAFFFHRRERKKPEKHLWGLQSRRVGSLKDQGLPTIRQNTFPLPLPYYHIPEGKFIAVSFIRKTYRAYKKGNTKQNNTNKQQQQNGLKRQSERQTQPCRAVRIIGRNWKQLWVMRSGLW